MESLNILYLTLSVVIALVGVFLTIALIYLMFILRDVTKIADKVKEITEKIDTYITKPIMLTKSVIEFITPFIQNAEEVVTKRRRKKKK